MFIAPNESLEWFIKMEKGNSSNLKACRHKVGANIHKAKSVNTAEFQIAKETYACFAFFYFESPILEKVTCFPKLYRKDRN